MPNDLHALRLLILLSLGVACGDKDDTSDSETAPTKSEPFPVPAGVTPSGSAVCEGAEPILGRSDLYTGFYRCPDGTAHRVEPAAVDPNWEHAACQGTEDRLSCTTDADCTEGTPYARCVSGTSQPDGEAYCGCRYACSTDADCGDGAICIAPEVGSTSADYPRCAPAACGSSDDCESGECGFSSVFDGCDYSPQTACRSEADTCRLDADCQTDTGDTPASCGVGYSETTYACHTPDCAAGRPLLLDGRLRTAPTTVRGDWSAPAVDAEALPSDELRARLVAHWSHLGALEHASVASFARFTLQLLALGAPPDLVADAQQAAADEVQHARLAYGLASHYAQETVGPGPLALRSADLLAGLDDPRAVLEALLEEGCLGETLGAAEARAAAAQATSSAVRAVLLQIAAEEAQHAALAWRTLRWLLATHPALRDHAAAYLRARVAVWTARAPGAEAGLEAHGILSGAGLRRLQRAALAAVVEPCLAAALG